MANPSENFEALLFNEHVVSMSEKETGLLFEQYKLYVEMMDKISERRYQANSFFLTVNTLLVTALTGFMTLTSVPAIQRLWIIIASIAGIVFCLNWRRLIQSYGELNNGKFKVIHQLERRLPAKLFEAEWEALNHGDGTRYTSFTSMERRVPIVFVALYTCLAFLIILNFFV